MLTICRICVFYKNPIIVSISINRYKNTHKNIAILNYSTVKLFGISILTHLLFFYKYFLYKNNYKEFSRLLTFLCVNNRLNNSFFISVCYSDKFCCIFLLSPMRINQVCPRPVLGLGSICSRRIALFRLIESNESL